MEGYKPPYSLTEEMMNLVSSISEKMGKIDVYHNLNTKPHLRRKNRIKSIHSSLKIEANSLSIGAVKDVIDGRIVLGPEREIQEVKNAYEAYEMIHSMNPYNIKDLLKVYGVMEKNWSWRQVVSDVVMKEFLMVTSVFLWRHHRILFLIL